MTFTPIVAASDVQQAFKELRTAVIKAAKPFDRTVGWPGGHRRFRVHWHARQGFWAVLHDHLKNRFWCAYGTQSPFKHKYVDITCEINPPKSGINRHCAGAFLKGTDGEIYVAHNGRVGGGREGIGQKTFLSFYGKQLEQVKWPDGKSTPLAIIGRVSSPTFLSDLANFIFAVEGFKERTNRKINQELDRDAAKAEREGVFDPKNIKETREMVLREINLRRGSPKFRKKLLEAYGGRCAISGYDCISALEAAHIRPYAGEETNHVQNGLLLRADLHTLFDLGMIGIDPRSRKVVVSKAITGTVYAKVNGRKLRPPTRPEQAPNSEVLRAHRESMED